VKSLPDPPSHPQTVSLEVAHRESPHRGEDEMNSTEQQLLCLVSLPLIMMELLHEALMLLLFVSQLIHQEGSLTL
jgi:hypothetical protein